MHIKVVIQMYLLFGQKHERFEPMEQHQQNGKRKMSGPNGNSFIPFLIPHSKFYCKKFVLKNKQNTLSVPNIV